MNKMCWTSKAALYMWSLSHGLSLIL